MIFSIPNLLNTEKLQSIQTRLEKAEFVEGKLTAGWHAKLVKNNQQLKSGTSLLKELKTEVEQVLKDNSLFKIAVRPRRVHSLLFSRYEEGMSYGTHTDNALMGSNLLRSDVSFTLFLNSPDEYEGGDLVIEGADDEKAYKLEAGTIIIYPSSTLHRVNTVTKGTRIVVVGWVQSLVRDASQREILFDLDTARRAMFAREGKTPEFDLISKPSFIFKQNLSSTSNLVPPSFLNTDGHSWYTVNVVTAGVDIFGLYPIDCANAITFFLSVTYINIDSFN
jgi:PKHD-type hydroxylase